MQVNSIVAMVGTKTKKIGKKRKIATRKTHKPELTAALLVRQNTRPNQQQVSNVLRPSRLFSRSWTCPWRSCVAVPSRQRFYLRTASVGAEEKRRMRKRPPRQTSAYRFIIACSGQHISARSLEDAMTRQTITRTVGSARTRCVTPMVR